MDIGQIIRDRAAANGVDPAVLARIAQIESSNNPNAGNDSSSAKGLFQFTDGTFKKYSSGNVFDPTTSADAGARFLKDNAAGLASSGLETSPGALYLAHFAGLGGARKLLTADPTTPAGDVLGAKAVEANPFLARMTVADLKNWAGGKMGDAGSSSAPTPAAAPTTAAGTPAAPAQPTGMLDGPAAPPADDGTTEQALASLKALTAPQQQAEPPPQMQPIQMPMPRRIDPAMLQKMLSSPLRAGFS
jgi:Transglycosylase SLT domain